MAQLLLAFARAQARWFARMIAASGRAPHPCRRKVTNSRGCREAGNEPSGATASSRRGCVEPQARPAPQGGAARPSASMSEFGSARQRRPDASDIDRSAPQRAFGARGTKSPVAARQGRLPSPKREAAERGQAKRPRKWREPPMHGWRRRQRRSLRSECSERRCNRSRPAGRLAWASGFAASWRAFQCHASAEPASTLHIPNGRNCRREVAITRTSLRLFRNDDSRNLVRATATKNAERNEADNRLDHVQRTTLNVKRLTLYVVHERIFG